MVTVVLDSSIRTVMPEDRAVAAVMPRPPDAEVGVTWYGTAGIEVVMVVLG